MRALRSSPGAGGASGWPAPSSTRTSSGIATRQADLDVPRGELVVERQRRLGEDVEEPKLERRADGRGEALAGDGRSLVTECGGCREVGLDGLNVSFDVHVTSI